MANKIACLAFILLITSFVLLPTNCKKQSTTPDVSTPLTDNEISVSCSPSSGGTGTIVNITISIKGNLQEIKAFGLELTFDPNMFQYQSTSSGSLTGSWASVDGNEISSGKLIVGGFTGSGTSIEKGESGSFTVVKFEVIYVGSAESLTRQITINHYKDDIVGMKPEPASTTFTYRK